MSARNANAWETTWMGVKIWLFALSATLFLPVLIVIMFFYALFGGKVTDSQLAEVKSDHHPASFRGPWSGQ